MGSNVGKDKELVSIVTKVVKEVATVPVWAKLTPSTTDIVVEARGALLGGADADRLVEHVHVAAAHRPGDARFRGPRRRPRVDRRPRRPGDPAAVAREDVAAHAGVSGPELFRHRRHLDVRARAELLPARVRHGPGVHGGDARSRDRPERHQGARTPGWRAFSRRTPTRAGPRSPTVVGLRRDRVVAQSKIRRPGEKDYRGGYEAEGVCRVGIRN